MLPGLEQRKLRFSCLSSPLSALAGTETESSSEVINLFPTPFLQFRGELILKSFLCFRHLLPFSFGPFSHLASLSFHVLLELSHLYLPLLFSVYFFFFASFVTSFTPSTSLSAPAAPCLRFLYLSEGNLFNAVTKSHHNTFKCKNECLN